MIEISSIDVLFGKIKMAIFVDDIIECICCSLVTLLYYSTTMWKCNRDNLFM